MGSYVGAIASAVGGMGGGGSSAPEYKRPSAQSTGMPNMNPEPLSMNPTPALNRSYVGASEPQRDASAPAPQWGQMISRLGNNGSSPFG